MQQRWMALGLCLVVSVLACGGDEASELGSGGGGQNVGFGGAQDIGQFRDILERGEIPGVNVLDANGFFSEHFAELPPPECGESLCLHGMLTVSRDWVWWRPQTTLQVAMNTPEDPAEIGDLPLDLAVVVDTSGSMSADDRLGRVRSGLHLMVDALEPGDRLALIEYSTTARVVTALSAPSASLHEAIDALEPYGSTNISAGLQLGFQALAVAEGEDEEPRQRRVILLSDGLANEGVTSTQGITDIATQFVGDGIGITTIGVGNDFNTELMRGLAELGAGNFYFVDSETAVSEIFLDELEYASAPLAYDVEIEVEETAGYTIGGVVGTRAWTASAGAGLIEIPAVFMATRTGDAPDPDGGRRGGGSAIFVALTPRPGAGEAGPAAVVRLRYRLPSGRIVTDAIELDSPYSPDAAEYDDYFSRELAVEHYGMYNMYLGLSKAAYAAQYSDACAVAILSELELRASEWNDVIGDEDIAADLELVQRFRANLEDRSPHLTEAVPDVTRACAGIMSADDPVGAAASELYDCGCAAAGGASRPWLLAVFAALAVVRRRRCVLP